MFYFLFNKKKINNMFDILIYITCLSQKKIVSFLF